VASSSAALSPSMTRFSVGNDFIGGDQLRVIVAQAIVLRKEGGKMSENLRLKSISPAINKKRMTCFRIENCGLT
jgi:hypothetical protein